MLPRPLGILTTTLPALPPHNTPNQNSKHTINENSITNNSYEEEENGPDPKITPTKTPTHRKRPTALTPPRPARVPPHSKI